MRTLFSLMFAMASLSISAQSKFVGTWQNVDDEDGKPKSHIQITNENGELKAKVIKLLPGAKLKVCESCTGANKGKPIEGMSILWGLKKVSEVEYSEGQILNPKNGKVYDATLTVIDGGKRLKVRGYMGISVLGKTQYWTKIN